MPIAGIVIPQYRFRLSVRVFRFTLPSPERSGSAMKSYSVPRATGVICVLICCALLSNCGTKSAPETSVTAHLTQITIAPANKSIPKGASLQLGATGIFSDGTQQDLTASVTWQATPASVASVDSKGDLDGLGTGVAQVSATSQGIVGNTSTTIGPPALLQISLTSKQSALPVGESEEITATGTFSDGSTQNLTDSVTWQSSALTVASITSLGNLKALAQGTAQISASSAGVTGSVSVTVEAPALLEISVSAQHSYLPIGESDQLTATGSFSDGSTQNLTNFVTWRVNPSTVASVNAQGNLKALSRGVAQVSLAYEGITGSGSITVGQPALLQIAVSSQQPSLPVGESELLTATGSFSDGSTQNLSNSVTWAVNPSTVASVTTQGNFKGLTRGVAQVSAAYQGVTGTASIAVGQAALLKIVVGSPQLSLPVGEAELLTAAGTFSDGSSQNLTNSVTWKVSPSTVATVSARGNLKALTQGVAQVTAAYEGVSGNTSVTVGQAALLQIALSPNPSSLPLGEAEDVTAIGSFSDGSRLNLTTSVAWSSSPLAIATVNATGKATGKSLGSATISASIGAVSGTASLTVTAPVVVGLNITPATSSLVIGSTGNLQAVATLSDGTTQNLTSAATWSSSQPAIVAVSSLGALTAEQVGSVTIDAQSGSFTASASLTVTPLMTVSYFSRVNSVASGIDGTLELANPGFMTGDTCAMVYVFDQQQELNECCGCTLSFNGMRTLSLLNDLTANTLTGKEPSAGVIEVVPATPGQNGICDPGSPSPNSMLTGWETNVQGTTGAYQLTEIPLGTVPLASVQAQVLATQCSVLERLGEGKGVCSCGSGD